MRRAGGTITVIGGVLAFIAALVTWIVAGYGHAAEANWATALGATGTTGMLIGFMATVLGTQARRSVGRGHGILIIVGSVLAAFGANRLLLVALAIIFIGGLLAALAKPDASASAEVAGALPGD